MARFVGVGLLISTLAIGALVAQEQFQTRTQPEAETPQILTTAYWVGDLTDIHGAPGNFEPTVLVAYLETLLKYEGDPSEQRIRPFDKTLTLIVVTSQHNHQLIEVALQDLRDRVAERKAAAGDRSAEESLRGR